MNEAGIFACARTKISTYHRQAPPTGSPRVVRSEDWPKADGANAVRHTAVTEKGKAVLLALRKVTRRLTGLAAVLASVFLVFPASTSPALAAEGGWYMVGPSPSDEPVATASWNDGDLFHVWRGEGSNERLYYTTSGPDGAFRTISEIPGGGRTKNAPSVAMRFQRPVVFHVGNNNGIYYQTYLGGGKWEGTWHNIPGNAAFNSIAVTPFNHGDCLAVTYRGTDNRMYFGWFDGDMNWHGGGEVAGGGETYHSPAIASLGDDTLYIAHSGKDGGVFYTWASLQYVLSEGRVVWRGAWASIPHLASERHTDNRPVMVSYGPDTDPSHNTTIDLAVVDNASTIQWTQYRASGDWSSWREVSGEMVADKAPSLWAWKNRQAVLYYTGGSNLWGKTLSDNL
ncbi:hypothetical protein [Streptomyces sp. NPDC002159]